MSRKLTAFLAAGTALLIAGGNAVALAGNASAKPKCSYALLNMPGSGAKGTESGTVTCPAPAGKGMATTSYTQTPHDDVTFREKGTFKDKFKHGTISGSYKIKSTDNGTHYSGHFQITGATGMLSGAHGSGTQKCSTPDAGVHYDCTTVLTRGQL